MSETGKALYLKLEQHRFSYLERARDCSRLTLPTLMPDEGDHSARKFPEPYQSIGARGVNNLASALLLSLLPPNAPFFRFVIDPKAVKNLEAMSPRARSEAENTLSDMERTVMKEIEAQAIRVALFEALKHLIVTGNVLLYFPDEGPMRVIRLDRYVVKRDPMGNVRKIVIKENVAPSMLPPEVAAMAKTCMCPHDSTVEIYTCCHTLPDGKVEVYQEIGGVVLPDSISTYPAERNPFLALRMHRVDGEDYGRGYVEQYYGDLVALDSLSKSILQASAAMAKVLFLVNPTGATRAKKIAQSPNGAIIEGNAQDVTVLQVQKAADLSVALQMMNAINERLSYAFLLTEASIRNAERVTAEEVRLVTQSIERQLGGIYSILSQEFQLPLVNRIVDRLTKSRKMPKIDKKFVTPTIVTGIDALGRGNDLNRLDIYLQGIAQILGPGGIQQYIDFREYLNRRAASLGIDTAGLVKTEEQIAQEQQVAMQQQMLAMAGPQAAKTTGNLIEQRMQQPQ
jgi:hypothetical protein